MALPFSMSVYLYSVCALGAHIFRCRISHFISFVSVQQDSRLSQYRPVCTNPLQKIVVSVLPYLRRSDTACVERDLYRYCDFTSHVLLNAYARVMQMSLGFTV